MRLIGRLNVLEHFFACSGWCLGALAGAALLFSSVPAVAQAQTAAADPNGLWQRSNLLGGIGGLRPALAEQGISLGLSETSEVLGNITGGIRQGADYDGLTQMSLTLNTAKAFGWAGGKFNVSALQIHGRSLSADNLDNLQTASGIEANRATRLWELWYQQTFFNGRADVRLGQQSIDQEFIVSQYAGLFVNTMMGWPMVPSADLYAGGPAYPLSSPGIRLRVHVTPALTVLGGVFDDNPPGGPFNNDSQLRGSEASGTRFNLTTGALWIGEFQYAANPSPSKSCDSVACGLPGTYKLGAWYDTAGFPDQRFSTDGLSLANPASNGIPRTDQGNYSIYAVIDQMIWRAGPDSPRTIGVFLRPMGAPSDRNQISFSLNAGVTLQAPFLGRPNDTLGLGYGFAQVSSADAALDRDTGFFTGTAYPVRSSESFIELTYQAQLAPWWLVQPDFQYVFNPGGGIQNPNHPSQRLADEAVVGVRTVITF